MLVVLLIAPLVRAEEDSGRAEILRKLERIEERLEKIERKLDALALPPKIGPLEPEGWTPVRVAVVIDLESLLAQPRLGGGGGAAAGWDLAVNAQVKLWRAPGPVRALTLSLHPPGFASCSSHWLASFLGGDDGEWRVGEERTMGFTMVDLVAYYGGYSFRSVLEALTRPRLHLYVDSLELIDGTAWGDTRSYWSARIERLEQGMSFEDVKKSLPPHDGDIGTQAFPGKPAYRSWLLSPRWMVDMHFGEEGLRGKPRLLPVGAHAGDRKPSR